MNLADYDDQSFDRGQSKWVEACWIILQGILFSSFIPGSSWRVRLLRMFGGKIGQGVIIKPHVRIKFPWRLEIGDHSWIGESVWIDNLACVKIGSSTCISQGVYFCTGNHEWKDPQFKLITKPIEVGSQSWIGAKCTILPGARVGNNCFIKAGQLIS